MRKTLFQFSICFAFIISLGIGAAVRSQTSSGDGVLRPGRKDLTPVHWPDLTKLEADVRQQLRSSQNALSAVANNPATPAATLAEAFGALGKTYHAYSLNAPARECYLNAARLMPKDFRWVYLLAKLDQLEDRFDEAISRYRIALALRPDYVAAAVNLGNIYLQLNRLENAEEDFKAALEIEKENAAANYGLGQVALSRRNYAAAVDYFERALAQVPAANRIHYSLAMAYRALGKIEKAKAHLAQQGTVGVRAADPLVDGLQELIAGARVHLVRGKQALEARRYAEAADEFRKAVAAKPDSLEARINLGAALTQTGDLQGAVGQFEEALRIDPGNSNARYNLALLLANENKHEPAIVHLQSLLSINPGDLGARLLLAQQLVKAARYEEALAEFSRVVRSDPDNETALLEQVKLLLWKKEYRQALENLERGHARNPQKGEIVVMLAYLLAASPQYDLRDGARALALAQSVYRATGQAHHGALVAIALAELGRCEEAAEWLQRMIAKGAEEGKSNLVEKMRAEMNRYESGRPCRPVADLSFSDYLLSR